MTKFVTYCCKVQNFPNTVNYIVQFNQLTKINFWLCVFDSKDIGKAFNRANILLNKRKGIEEHGKQ